MTEREPMSPEQLAIYQQMFGDAIPHCRAMGIRIVDVDRGKGTMALDWREDLVGNPETGVLHGGAITTLLDSCCGMAVATVLTDPQPFATLDLRIDYVRPATPREAVIADAECFRITANVAFVRAIAHHGNKEEPIAAVSGTFMLATKGQPRVDYLRALEDRGRTLGDEG